MAAMIAAGMQSTQRHPHGHGFALPFSVLAMSGPT